MSSLLKGAYTVAVCLEIGMGKHVTLAVFEVGDTKIASSVNQIISGVNAAMPELMSMVTMRGIGEISNLYFASDRWLNFETEIELLRLDPGTEVVVGMLRRAIIQRVAVPLSKTFVPDTQQYDPNVRYMLEDGVKFVDLRRTDGRVDRASASSRTDVDSVGKHVFVCMALPPDKSIERPLVLVRQALVKQFRADFAKKIPRTMHFIIHERGRFVVRSQQEYESKFRIPGRTVILGGARGALAAVDVEKVLAKGNALIFVDGATPDVFDEHPDLMTYLRGGNMGIHALEGEYDGKPFDATEDPSFLGKSGPWAVLRHNTDPKSELNKRLLDGIKRGLFTYNVSEDYSVTSVDRSTFLRAFPAEWNYFPHVTLAEGDDVVGIIRDANYGQLTVRGAGQVTLHETGVLWLPTTPTLSIHEVSLSRQPQPDRADPWVLLQNEGAIVADFDKVVARGIGWPSTAYGMVSNWWRIAPVDEAIQYENAQYVVDQMVMHYSSEQTKIVVIGSTTLSAVQYLQSRGVEVSMVQISVKQLKANLLKRAEEKAAAGKNPWNQPTDLDVEGVIRSQDAVRTALPTRPLSTFSEALSMTLRSLNSLHFIYAASGSGKSHFIDNLS